MAALIDERPNGFYGAVYDAAHSDAILSQVDSAGADAGNLHQVIHQTRQLSDLAFNDRLRFTLELAPLRLQAQQMDSVENRREGAAKLVAEHRQEFVLARMQVRQLRLLASQHAVGRRQASISLLQLHLQD